MTPSQLDAGKRAPRPIKVGDTVRFGRSLPGTVVAIDEGFAWVRWATDWTCNCVCAVSDLVRVSP